MSEEGGFFRHTEDCPLRIATVSYCLITNILLKLREFKCIKVFTVDMKVHSELARQFGDSNIEREDQVNLLIYQLIYILSPMVIHSGYCP